MTVTVSAFYRFVPIAGCEELRRTIDGWCRSLGIRGTILIAAEGINGTISGDNADILEFFDRLRADTCFAGLAPRSATADRHPFRRLKVRIRPEIVTLGVVEADPGRRVGTYVAPRDWNALIRAPDVLLIDTRNSYEVAVGTFKGAVDPGTRTFGEFPEFVRKQLDPARHRRVAMFCTGGIRCEKATSYLLSQGFAEVYHLEGGILGYLETVPPEDSLWRGGCFVFDDRVAVGHGLDASPRARCSACGQPMVRAEDDAALPPAAAPSCPSCQATA